MKAIATENKINNKTCEILFSDYFKLRYGFSFATAGALARDTLRLTTTLNSYSLKEGQILRYVVSNTEPAGKALKDCQFVLAKLTVYAPEDAEYRRKYGLKELKLRVMQRIINEAISYGGCLSQKDIGEILFLDRGTVSDYLKELESRHIHIATRANFTKKDIKIPSKRDIIEMFLQGSSKEEIVRHTGHLFTYVEECIMEFLRVGLYHRWNHPISVINQSLKLDPVSIHNYIKIYQSFLKDRTLSKLLHKIFSFYENSLLLAIKEEKVKET